MALTPAERSKIYREKIKQDPVKREIHRKKELKRLQKLSKKIKDLSEEEKQEKRKLWREQKRKQKAQKIKKTTPQSPKNTSETDVKMALTPAERMKKYREKLKKDPQKFAEMKKKHTALVKARSKKISEISKDEQDRIRKIWREQKRRQAAKKQQNTENNTQTSSESSQAESKEKEAKQHCIVQKEVRKRALTNAEKQKRYREKLKDNPAKKEEIRKKNIERIKSKAKRVQDMTEDEKIARRNTWRKQKQNQKKKVAEKMDEALLIVLVERYEELYNLNHPNYISVQRRDNIWEEIGSILKQKGITCKERWARIRDNYRNELISKIKPPKYDKELSFLDPFLRDEENWRSIKSESETEDDNTISFVQSNIEDLDGCFPSTPVVTDSYSVVYLPESNTLNTSSDGSPSRDASSFTNLATVGNDETDVLEQYLKERQQTTAHSTCHSNLDPLTDFFLTMAKTVKTFPVHEQVNIKAEIFKLVSTVEMKLATTVSQKT